MPENKRCKECGAVVPSDHEFCPVCQNNSFMAFRPQAKSNGSGPHRTDVPREPIPRRSVAPSCDAIPEGNLQVFLRAYVSAQRSFTKEMLLSVVVAIALVMGSIVLPLATQNLALFYLVPVSLFVLYPVLIGIVALRLCRRQNQAIRDTQLSKNELYDEMLIALGYCAPKLLMMSLDPARARGRFRALRRLKYTCSSPRDILRILDRHPEAAELVRWLAQPVSTDPWMKHFCEELQGAEAWRSYANDVKRLGAHARAALAEREGRPLAGNVVDAFRELNPDTPIAVYSNKEVVLDSPNKPSPPYQ